MTQEVTLYDFREWFSSSDTYKNNFSWEGLEALYNYLTDLEEATGTQEEFDPIAICVEFTEYDSFKEFKNNYSNIKSKKDLEDHTTVIKIEGTDRFIIQDF